MKNIFLNMKERVTSYCESVQLEKVLVQNRDEMAWWWGSKTLAGQHSGMVVASQQDVPRFDRHQLPATRNRLSSIDNGWLQALQKWLQNRRLEVT